jgi:ribose transport system permease protein
MKRVLGVVTLLAVMYFLLYLSDPANAFKWGNLKDVLNQQTFFGVLTLGVGLVIITGGIDLSIGSVVGLGAIGFGVLMRDGVHPYVAAIIVLAGGVVIGLIHGLLISRLKLQSFLVTLCGLFVYRGLARMLSPGRPVGLQQVRATHPESADALDTLRQVLTGKSLDGEFGFPMQVVVLLVLAFIIAVVLHGSVYGRYWYAIGRNEQAARYAGINTNRLRLGVYIICSTLAALGGILTTLDYGSATPETTGETWELYAITGAVLGGCSLRGGEGTVIGMVLGAAVLPLLKNLISFVGTIPFVANYIPKIDPVIPVLIGLTLLLGTIVDEFFRRRAAPRKSGLTTKAQMSHQVYPGGSACHQDKPGGSSVYPGGLSVPLWRTIICLSSSPSAAGIRSLLPPRPS